MKKIAAFLSLLCILNVLAIGGLVGFLWGTGRLDTSKVQAISDLLKHEGTPDGLRGKLADILQPVATTAPAASTAPASRPTESLVGSPDEPATAEERVNYMRRAMEQDRLKLENEAQDLRHRQELLAQTQTEIDLKLKKIEADKKTFEQQTAATSGKKDGESFKKSMALFDELKPKQVKDLFTGMTPEDSAKYLSAMEPDRAAKIIGEFKTPEEKAYIGSVLERIRNGSAGAGTGAASGLGTGNTALSAASPNSPTAAPTAMGAPAQANP